MNTFFSSLKRKVSVKKAIYFLSSIRYAYYELKGFKSLLDKNGYRERIMPAIIDIQNEINANRINEYDLAKFLYNEEPYLGYLYFNANEDISLLVFSFLMKDGLNVLDIFTTPLEEFSKYADQKYKITKLEYGYEANHQGIFLQNTFYYYCPLIFTKRNAKNPPPLIELLIKQRQDGNQLWIRLDETLSIDRHNYNPFYREFFEIYQGRPINLDNIQFPFNRSESEPFCVYNPKTMKRIQFKISHRKDSEK